MPGWRPRYPDRIVGIVGLGVSVALFAWTFTFRIVEWDALGMAFWPRATLAAIAILSAYFLVRGSLDGESESPILNPRAFLLPAGGLAFVISSAWLGFTLSSAIALSLLTAAIAPHRRWRWFAAAGTGLAWTAVTWALFTGTLGVQLPRGVFG